MAKRVALVLSGCGAGDGSEIREAVLTLLMLDRAGAQVIFAAPEAARIASAQIARGPVRPLSELRIDEVDALTSFVRADEEGSRALGQHGPMAGITCDEPARLTCDPHPAELVGRHIEVADHHGHDLDQLGG